MGTAFKSDFVHIVGLIPCERLQLQVVSQKINYK